MNNQEAQFILRAYRAQGQDASDPHFAAALEQARLDPVLGQWLAREQALDGAISGCLSEIQPPAHLRASILAGAKASRLTPWWRRPITLTLAASLTVLLALAALGRSSPRGPLTGRELAQRAARDVRISHAFMSHPQPNRVSQWISTSAAPLRDGFPFTVSDLRADGCRTARLAGIEVFEICFDRGGEYHLFIAHRSSVEHPPADIEFSESLGLATARWSDSEHVYVLVSRAGSEALKRIL